MYCIKCGKMISDESSFCQFCGEKVPPIQSANTIVVAHDCIDQNQSAQGVEHAAYAVASPLTGNLLKKAQRQRAIFKCKEALNLPTWMHGNADKKQPFAFVDIFITDESIVISKSPEKSSKSSFIEKATFAGRVLGGPLLGAIPHAIGLAAQAALSEKEMRNNWGDLFGSKEVLWIERASCKHFIRKRKFEWLGDNAYEHWCFSGAFHHADGDHDLLVVFGRHDKNEWAKLFKDAGIVANDEEFIDKKTPILATFKDYPHPVINQDHLDWAEF